MADKETSCKCHEMQPHSFLDCSGTAPPDNRSQLPLTPPATAEKLPRASDASDFSALVRLLHSYRHRAKIVDLAPWIEINVNREQYGLLRETIERLFQRFDFEPANKTLILRMPSPGHDFFSNLLAKELQHQLESIASRGGSIGTFAAAITSGGSSRILLLEGEPGSSSVVRRQPDAQFQHPEAVYPGVVLEVSDAQDGKNVPKIAQDYILYSNGDIKAVVGVDIHKDEDANLSLWCPKYTWSAEEEIKVLEAEAIISNVPFRLNGSAINEVKCLELHLSDFATDALCSGQESVLICITFKRLFDLLVRAERMEQARESTVAGGVKSRRVTRKRRAPSSSEEEFQLEDEARYASLEEAAAEKAHRDDEEFEEPATKRRVKRS
ncbi:hypothetical protein J3458_018248 [Metarhizium acridum]|uniref:uncharacterized protein n=1 Tax=Metarhizium acridum TaxID=92637 RepID=UPI001C6B1142|nr:hypothetical protein J3458_018248 [Metarhizium acridum]